MQNVLKQYGFPATSNMKLLGNGLINTTWLLETGGSKFVVQQVNQLVFKSPADIAFNIRLIADHLEKYHPGYQFAAPVKTLDGSDMVKTASGYFRVFPFISGSHSIDVAESPDQAFEAAFQFARFTKLLSGLPAVKLKITLPGFHDLSLRFNQFESSLKTGNTTRISQSGVWILFLLEQRTIMDQFERSKMNYKTRCTHHDTKISNVLFNSSGKGLCVIDLDTVMPGYFISDVGDMMRTYLSPVNEEESETDKIIIRKDFYEAIVQGYLSEMGPELTETEKEQFHFSGLFMVYMQALRFLTDHINNDVYYGSRYEGQNLVRAINQATLLKRLIEFNPH